MKKIYAVASALLVLLSIAMSAAALEYKTAYRQNGITASAEWDDTTANSSTYKFLGVTETDDGTDIYLSICTSDNTGNYSCKWGYTFTKENVFDVSGKLESATLSAVQIDLYGEWIPPTPEIITPETVTVQAQWTGVGDLTKGSYKSISKYGDYVSKYSDSSTVRQATATGSLNGQDLGTSDLGAIIKFKSASMYMEK